MRFLSIRSELVEKLVSVAPVQSLTYGETYFSKILRISHVEVADPREHPPEIRIMLAGCFERGTHRILSHP